MEDFFAVFQLPRRPSIDEPALKERYLKLAARWHPDIADNNDEQFHALRDAYRTLREPGARLRHLMELEFPRLEEPVAFAPNPELFLFAGNAVQAAKSASARLENTTSSVARTLLAPKIASAVDQVREAMKSVEHARDELRVRLQSLDARWPEVSPREMAALASSFTFVSRWFSELSEWEFRLTHG